MTKAEEKLMQIARLAGVDGRIHELASGQSTDETFSQIKELAKDALADLAKQEEVAA